MEVVLVVVVSVLGIHQVVLHVRILTSTTQIQRHVLCHVSRIRLQSSSQTYLCRYVILVIRVVNPANCLLRIVTHAKITLNI